MRLLLALLFTLAHFSPAVAASFRHTNYCQSITDGDETTFGLAQVTGKPGEKIYFQWDADQDCTQADPRFCQKMHVKAGDYVVTGRSYKGFRCSEYVAGRDSGYGWLPQARLREIPVSTADAWDGEWTNSHSLSFATTPKGIRAKGSAVYKHAIGDTQDICTHFGIINGTALPQGNHLRMTNVPDGENEVPLDCVLDLWLLGDFLVARDNQRCGGTNVTFTGIYTRSSGGTNG